MEMEQVVAKLLHEAQSCDQIAREYRERQDEDNWDFWSVKADAFRRAAEIVKYTWPLEPPTTPREIE